jgi:beta-glucosidase
MNEVSFFDMNFRPGANNPGRGYRFYTGEGVVYPFGAGLSYTTFVYDWAIEKILAYGLSDALVVLVTVEVTNVGEMTGSDTVLVFLVPPPDSIQGQPIQQLRQFEKVNLDSKKQEMISFSLTERDFSLANMEGQMEVIHGTWTIQIGDQEQEVTV